jgi:hypothetical protein
MPQIPSGNNPLKFAPSPMLFSQWGLGLLGKEPVWTRVVQADSVKSKARAPALCMHPRWDRISARGILACFTAEKLHAKQLKSSTLIVAVVIYMARYSELFRLPALRLAGVPKEPYLWNRPAVATAPVQQPQHSPSTSKN